MENIGTCSLRGTHSNIRETVKLGDDVLKRLFRLILYFSSAAMIHWARQIKEVLSNQDAFEMAENSGPLDEIEFWKNRCADLTGISTQLDKPGVKKITEILTLAKSSYVGPFLKLSSEIKVF